MPPIRIYFEIRSVITANLRPYAVEVPVVSQVDPHDPSKGVRYKNFAAYPSLLFAHEGLAGIGQTGIHRDYAAKPSNDDLVKGCNYLLNMIDYKYKAETEPIAVDHCPRGGGWKPCAEIDDHGDLISKFYRVTFLASAGYELAVEALDYESKRVMHIEYLVWAHEYIP